MQKSRNSGSSNIPLPKFKRTLSSECLRDSQNKQVLKRSKSSLHLEVPPLHVRRSSIKSDLSRDYRGSNSNLASASKFSSSLKRSINTPLRTGLGCSSFARRILTTPSQSGTGNIRPSPSLSLTSQKINDKKFSSEQFRKTCVFLEERIEDFDPKILKELTLASFVNVVTILFNEIDTRIKINMENYKETVFKYMKLYKYPGPVSISMLKSAYTSLSWAPIMAMFGWLIDLIRLSNGEEYEDDNLKKYIALGSIGKFKGFETKNLYVNFIDKVLGLDRIEYKVLSSECQKFEMEKNQKKKIVEELQSEKKTLSEELERMKFEIKEFKEGDLENKIENEINHLKSECDKRECKIEEMKSSITETKEIISRQKYSLNDKRDMKKTLEDLSYSLNMKIEKLEGIKRMKDDYDYKQTNLRRQIEAETHEINNRLLQVKSVLFSTDIKKIQLPNRGFHSQQFVEAVEEKILFLQSFREKVERELSVTKNKLDDVRNECNVISNDISDRKRVVASLEEELDRLSVESDRLNFESDVIINQLEKQIATLMETAPDVKALEIRKIELHKELLGLDEEMKQLSYDSIAVFKKLHEDAVVEGTAMRNIMSDIYEKSFEAFQHHVLKMEATEDVLHNGLPPQMVAERN